MLLFLEFIKKIVNAKIKGKKVIVFEIPIIGEIPYIQPLVDRFMEEDKYSILFACRNRKVNKIKQKLKSINHLYYDSWFLINKHILHFFPFVDIFITSEQFSLGLPFITSVCIFHGQPSKGITFSIDILNSFDHFFLFGQLHEEALKEFTNKNVGKISYTPKIHRIGYPKLDKLIMKGFNREDILNKLQLDSSLKTLLYAPAFNDYASLRTKGQLIIKSLINIRECNLIIKLAPDSIESPDNYYATGNVDWIKTIKCLETNKCKLVTDLDISPYLEASDIMITDVSGVAYDFLYLNKPVVFFDCPDFYHVYLPSVIDNFNVEEYLSKDTQNAGRNYGIVVETIEQLVDSVKQNLSNPQRNPSEINHNLKLKLIDNPGNASSVAFNEIHNILKSGIPSLKPRGFFYFYKKKIKSKCKKIFDFYRRSKS